MLLGDLTPVYMAAEYDARGSTPRFETGICDAIAMDEEDSSEDNKEDYEPVALHFGADGHDVSGRLRMALASIARR
jgi:hypothetical protein